MKNLFTVFIILVFLVPLVFASLFGVFGPGRALGSNEASRPSKVSKSSRSSAETSCRQGTDHKGADRLCEEFRPTTQSLYIQGVHAYQQENWDEAQKLFQQSLGGEPLNSLILYNLGLVAYKKKQLGMALALWRHALSLNPYLGEAQRALSFGLKQVPSLSQNSHGFFTTYLGKIVDRTLLRDVLLACAILIPLSGGLFFKYWGSRKRALAMEIPLPPLPSFTIFLSALCVLCLLLGLAKAIFQFSEKATVIVSQAKLLLHPSPDGITIGEILEGAEVRVKKRSEGWVQIMAPNKSVGWLSESEIYPPTLFSITQEEVKNTMKETP